MSTTTVLHGVHRSDMPMEGAVHLRRPSLDRLKAKMLALNCYVAQRMEETTSTLESDGTVFPGAARRSNDVARSHKSTPYSRVSARSGSSANSVVLKEIQPNMGTSTYLGHIADGDVDAKDTRGGWKSINPTRFQVRGRNYLRDHRKIPSLHSVMRCIAVDVFLSNKLEEDFAARPGTAAHKILAEDADAELFLLNIQLPGPPHISQVYVFERVPDSGDHPDLEPAQRLWEAFRDASPEFRSRRLKIVAQPVQGPLAIRAAVPNRPAIVGSRMPLRWHQHDRSLEVVMDVAFSPVAAPVWRLMRGVTRKLALDLCLIIEATGEDQLPESVLGCLQWHKPDFLISPECPKLPPTPDLQA
mmetsp:Transcript_30240/g.81267  ORF Transcript_30240/g.81267 Transcript_30240/m.81267 type:complete len:358 (+) Transcript_30240:61-1134(+)